MSLTGLVLQFSYRLQRHFRFGQPLARWLGLVLLVVAGWSLYRCWPFAWQAALLTGLFLGYVLVLVWAARSGYVRFQPDASPDGLSGAESTPDAPGALEPVRPLRPEELVPVRVSGWFTVEGQDQYFVDVEAGIETVGTREHIVMACIKPTRFLLLGKWPMSDTGWWYIFFQPSTIQEIRPGHLTFGARSRQALRIVYAPDADTVQTLYLAFDDPVALRRVWDDLVIDAAEAAG
jgi:hypothetical protein